MINLKIKLNFMFHVVIRNKRVGTRDNEYVFMFCAMINT